MPLALSKVIGHGVKRPKELWALYRLGMYRSVLASCIDSAHWRVSFAKAVSSAACGEFDNARQFVAAFLTSSGADRERVNLAAALAGYLPEVAVDLLERRRELKPALAAALLLGTGRLEDARTQLAWARASRVKANADLYLLETNALGGDACAQLGRLNAYLGERQVSRLSLRNPLLAPSPTNVAAAGVSKAVDGPLVSILMTTYRTGGRAALAVESLLEQSYRNLDVTVVDDASDDGTLGQLQALEQHCPRLRVIALPRNVGTYAAKLIGLAAVRGEFVMCHDSDDWSHPDRLARQMAPLMADKNLVGTVSDWLRMQDDGRFHARLVYPLARLNPSSLLFRRELVLREAGAWDCVRTGADSEFIARLRVVFGPRAIRKVAQPLSLGSHRPGSLMTAQSTGYTSLGVSPQRLAYWEAWSRWHIDTLARGESLFISADVRTAVAVRRFPAPQELLVAADDVEACWCSAYSSAATRNRRSTGP